MRAAARASTSLDQPIGEDEDAVFGDFVAGDGPLPDEEVERRLRNEALERGARGASRPGAPGARAALRARRAPSRSTLEQIGTRLGITRERVRQIEVESLSRLASLREMRVRCADGGAAAPAQNRRRARCAPRPAVPGPRPQASSRNGGRVGRWPSERDERGEPALEQIPAELVGVRAVVARAGDVPLTCSGQPRSASSSASAGPSLDGLRTLRVRDHRAQTGALGVLGEPRRGGRPRRERHLHEHRRLVPSSA